MRILWMSNSPWMGTGYSNQTDMFTKRIKAAGHEVTIASYRGLEGGSLIDGNGILNMPRLKDPHYGDVIEGRMMMVQADMVFSLIDVFALDELIWGRLPWAAINPVDCEPVLPNERGQLAACRWPCAMSMHGFDQMKAIGLDPLYIPHGVETNTYKPVDRAEARERLYLKSYIRHKIPQEAFLVITVANNGEGMPSRKNFSGMMLAFAKFSATHPDALYYIHAESLGVHHGEPLVEMAQFYGIADKVIFPQEYIMTDSSLTPPDVLNAVYNAGDVFMLLSRGEGYGLPTAEAQSAGCPVILTKFSSHIELCTTGWLVDGQRYSFYPLTEQMIADSDKAAQCLTEAYDLWKNGDMPSMRSRTRDAALKFDIDGVMSKYMIPALSRISADLVREPQEQWLRRKHRPAPSDKYMRRMEKKKAHRA